MKKTASVLLGLFVVVSGCATSDTSAPTRLGNAGEMKGRAQDETAEERELAREWDEAREQLRRQLEQPQNDPTGEEGGQDETEPLPPEPAEREWRTPQAQPVPSFAYLRRFQPDDAPNGYGADILLNSELSEEGLIALVKRLAGSHDPVVIRIFTSRTAYAQEQSGNYGPEYDRDYILFYVKNLSGRGAYSGCNEIRWMQVTGRFSAKAGTKTRL